MAEETAVALEAGNEVSAEGPRYTIVLPNFEGPLDLLLHLIQQHELDIMDIPIAFVTEKYLDAIVLMQELNIDVASEYLVMAATLAHIKSRMLLPVAPEDGDEADAIELDPRAELVRRLLEYQKYKHAAADLAERSIFGRDVFGRGSQAPTDTTRAPLMPLSIFNLLEAFQLVLDRAKTTVDHEIELDRFSITDRINQLVDRLRDHERVLFEELFDGQRTRPALIVTFLALLEMTRLRMVRLVQAGPLESIAVELSVADASREDLDRELAAENPATTEAESENGEEPSPS